MLTAWTNEYIKTTYVIYLFYYSNSNTNLTTTHCLEMDNILAFIFNLESLDIYVMYVLWDMKQFFRSTCYYDIFSYFAGSVQPPGHHWLPPWLWSCPQRTVTRGRSGGLAQYSVCGINEAGGCYSHVLGINYLTAPSRERNSLCFCQSVLYWLVRLGEYTTLLSAQWPHQ